MSVGEPPRQVFSDNSGPQVSRAFREWLSDVWRTCFALHDTNGNAVVGTANLATTAKNGFLYIPIVAGTPTGIPTVQTGYRAICVDPTGGAGTGKLWIYNGSAWKGVNIT